MTIVLFLFFALLSSIVAYMLGSVYRYLIKNTNMTLTGKIIISIVLLPSFAGTIIIFYQDQSVTMGIPFGLLAGFLYAYFKKESRCCD